MLWVDDDATGKMTEVVFALIKHLSSLSLSHSIFLFFFLFTFFLFWAEKNLLVSQIYSSLVLEKKKI